MRRELFADRIEQWIGVPFKWQGRIRAGCDCKGLFAGVAAELGFPEADSMEALCGDYVDDKPVPVFRLREGMARMFTPVPIAERLRGDILLVNLRGRAQHMAACAPLPGKPTRTIEALCEGPMKVMPFRRPVEAIDSVWRWSD